MDMEALMGTGKLQLFPSFSYHVQALIIFVKFIRLSRFHVLGYCNPQVTAIVISNIYTTISVTSVSIKIR